MMANKGAHCTSFFRLVSSLACILYVGGIENELGGCIDPRFRNIHCLRLVPHRLIIQVMYTNRWRETHKTHIFSIIKNTEGFYHKVTVIIWYFVPENEWWRTETTALKSEGDFCFWSSEIVVKCFKRLMIVSSLPFKSV